MTEVLAVAFILLGFAVGLLSLGGAMIYEQRGVRSDFLWAVLFLMIALALAFGGGWVIRDAGVSL